jgi:hypothetical protein
MTECATLKKNEQTLEQNVEIHNYNARKKMEIHVQFCKQMFSQKKSAAYMGNKLIYFF